jgi:hypothetical protein
MFLARNNIQIMEYFDVEVSNPASYTDLLNKSM